MLNGWLTHAGPYKVEHVPVPHPGPLAGAALIRRKGVQHTTEGSALEGALSRFRVEMVGSTFLVGRDLKRRARLLQLIPLGYAAAALRHTGKTQTNGLVIAQVELVGFSQIKVWEPDDAVEDMLAALYWQLEHSCGIPLRHVANPSRSNARWIAAEGWLGHVDVPQNDHVDPRALDYHAIFARTHKFQPHPKSKVKPKPRPVVLAPKVATLKRRARKTAPAPLCAGGSATSGRLI